MKNVLTFLAILMSFTLQAQDQIILKSGETIQAKVLELAPEQIKYKRFDHLSGPTIVIARADVFLINYENGKSEVISALEAKPAATEAPTQLAPVTPPAHQGQAIPPKEETTDDIYESKPVYNEPPALRPQPAATQNSTSTIYYNDEEWLMSGGAALTFDGYSNTGLFLNLERDGWFSKNIGWTSSLSLSYNEVSGDYSYESGELVVLLPQVGLTVRSDPGSFGFYAKALIGASWASLSGDMYDAGEYYDFTVGAGAGFIINDQIDIGARFYQLTAGFSQLQLGIGYRFY
jgi:hypothetical protein